MMGECPACGFETDAGDTARIVVNCKNQSCRVDTYYAAPSRLRACYDSADYQMAECTDTLSVPVSDPATFSFYPTLDKDEFHSLIDTLRDEQLVTGEFADWTDGNGYWTAAIGQAETRCKAKITNDEMLVYPTEEDFVPFEWFESLYEDVSTEVGVKTTPVPRTRAGDKDG